MSDTIHSPLPPNDPLLTLVMDISGRFLKSDDDALDQHIQEALEQMGRFAEADRAYLFLMKHQGTSMDNTHEWCREGIAPQQANLQDLDAEEMTWLMPRLRSGKTLYIPDVAGLPPEAASERAEFQRQDIGSLLVHPLCCGHEFLGFLGFDAVGQSKSWPSHADTLLRFIGETFIYSLQGRTTRRLLQESQENLSSFFHGNRDFLWVLDEQGIILSCNQTVFNRLGYSPSELIGHSILLVHPKERREEAGAIVQAMLMGTRDSCPIPLMAKNGLTIPVETTIARGRWSGQNALFGTSRDISELKKSEEKFASVFQCSPALIGLSDLDTGEYLDVNQTFCQALGFTKDEVIGKKAKDLVRLDPAFRDRVIAEMRQTGSIRNEEAVIHKKDGQPLPVILSAEVISLQDRMVNLTTAIDITHQKQAEAELSRMHRLRSLGTLAGGIAHDFNNLLMAIFGNLNLMEEELGPHHPLHPLAQETARSIDRATRLTKQLLTFAKGGEPLREVTSLTSLVEKTVSFDLAGSSVKPRFTFPDDLWLADIDPGQIQQVVANLTINARQAMPQGGTLTLAMRNLTQTTVPEETPARFVELTMTDQGRGIPEDHLQRIFEPYFTTKPDGNGLGLATAHSIILKHGGKINVRSTQGKGTTFTILLPAARQQTAAAPPDLEPSPTGSFSPRVQKVLLMDDEPVLCRVVGKMLAKMGLSVVTVPDGQLALNVYQEHLAEGRPFDFVIMDLTIPGGMGGKETVVALQHIDPKACCIVSSGYADDPILAHHRDYGFCGAIEKPFTLAKLREVLQACPTNL
jgi:PAS domain S-box-containing protein